MPASSHDRLTLGNAAILRLSNAVALLPFSDSDAREWLKSAGLVRLFNGKCFVIWGEVVDALRRTERLGTVAADQD